MTLMTDTNPAKFTKLVTLLRELFQLDQPDLDFGIYRIMHAKAGEVTQFLERDLLPQVKTAFAGYQTADKSVLQADLAKAIEQAQALGADPDALPKVKELRERIANEAVDIGALESETYDHLYSFFRRYYSEGDFLAKRVYKPGVYAIPYEGEEVTLHWANKDQYYIKTSEYLRDYAFRLKPEAGEGDDPMRVRFKLVDATEGEHGNVKAAEGKDRVFVLAQEDFIGELDGELELRFEYRPAMLEDWPADDRDGKKKAPTQKELTALAVQAVLGAGSGHAQWLAELGKLHVKADGEQADYSRLEAHLRRYAARNTFDYFIHKDLGTFLRRELDFYIKNEVMHLDDVESETAPKVEQYLSKIKVIRRIAGKIIDFLAQLENFQKKLWLKKKFVVGSDWLVAISQVPDEFLPDVCANSAQLEEWKELHSLHELQEDVTRPAYSEPLRPEFLRALPSLMVNTRHFDAVFVAKLLEHFDGLDDVASGTLIQSENFQALALLQAKYQNSVDCIYVDPPYNTGDDGFPYRDAYQHSSWLAMLADRLASGRNLGGPLSTLSVSIDDVELDRLCEMLRGVYGEQELAKLVWDKNRKNDAKFFSVGHEYMVVLAKNKQDLIKAKVRYREPIGGLEDAKAHFQLLREQFNDDWEQIRLGWLQWFENIPVSDPRRRMIRHSKVGSRGPYRDDGNPSWPGGGGPRYQVLHPATGKPCKVPSRGWVWPTSERFWEVYEEGRIAFGPDESTTPAVITLLFESDGQVMPSVHYSYAQTSAQEFDALFGKRVFDNPKNWRDIARLIRYLGGESSLTLDYFAGSGTTGHAVVNLNREDGGARKFVLIEMADYFDRVLVPRIEKVIFSPEWGDGRPRRVATPEEAARGPRVLKVLKLESYEDTLNNLALIRSTQQQAALVFNAAQGADSLREDYLLRYQLNVESRDSASLLNIAAFSDPNAYKLLVKTPGSDESREVNVDLLETFNWLLGLTVQHIAAPRSFVAEFERDGEGRLHIKDRLKQDATGPWWFRTVTGTTPEGRKTLVIWRKLTGNAEQDNLVLETWFRDKQAFSVRDTEFDLIYVNGDNTLENIRLDDESWKVRLTEEDFQRLMFEGTE